MKIISEKEKNWTTWFEIPVSNFERAKKFYETIFETELEINDHGPFKMGIFPHKQTGCAICKGEKYVPGTSGPIVYMDANPDLKLVQDRIEKAGGSVTLEKKQISPEHGYMAVFVDTEGNRLCLHSDS